MKHVTPVERAVTRVRGNLLDSIEDRFNELRRELLGRSGEWEPPPWPGTVDVRLPVTDVIEEDDRFVVSVELPGFDKKDVRLEVEEDGVLVRAFRSTEAETKPRAGQRWLRHERMSRSFERYVRFPDEVSPDGARATFRNGVLEIVVPRATPEKRRRQSIEID